MNRDHAIELVRGRLVEYVERITDRSGTKFYVCPLCGSGTGRNRTGAFLIRQDQKHWNCFSCGEHGDIFDLYGYMNNAHDFDDQFNGLCQEFGVNVDKSGEYIPVEIPIKLEAETKEGSDVKAEKVNYSNFYLRAHENIKRTDYPQKRGLSDSTINRFYLGFVEDWKHPKSPSNASATPRLIIPISNYGYLARDTREDIPDAQKNFSKAKCGSMDIYNRRALGSATDPIFVVEGELDALSIIDVGGEAVALGSTSMKDAFVKACENEDLKQPLILCLDDDESGKKTTEYLKKQFDERHILYKEADICNGTKDPNEALQKDRRSFAESVKNAIQEARNVGSEIAKTQEAELEEDRNAYNNHSALFHLEKFMYTSDYFSKGLTYATGFPYLDDTLDGGLHAGLYVLGAISSLGKTTFVTQIADQIAESGTDVLIFSLEMSRVELIAKNLSRRTLKISKNLNRSPKNAKTTRGLMSNQQREKHSDDDKRVLMSAIQEYCVTSAENTFIIEGVGDIGIEKISETIKKHIRIREKKPIVIIDYLQILAPYDIRCSDKQNTDKAVLELKRISRDLDIPVIAISSLNRQNYQQKASMEAFKESGSIEYSSDVLLMLQLNGAGKTDFNVDEEKKKDPREVELVILKNRNGKTGDKIGFKYYPKFNFFDENAPR